MQFTKVGKTYQLVIQNGEDLKNILTLDEALWGATSAPSNIFKCDPAFIALLDPAKSGRITSNTVKDAIKWFLDKLKDDAAVVAVTDNFDGNFVLDSLKIASTDATTQKQYVSDITLAANGEKKLSDLKVAAIPLFASSLYILREIGAVKGSGECNKITEKDMAGKAITLKQVRDFLANVAKRPFNGDGIISIDGSKDVDFKADLEQLMPDVIAATGGVADASGTQGASEQNIKDFLAAAADYLAWLEQGKIPAGQTKTDIMPFGADTAAYNSLVKEADPLITQFFTLSGLLGFDERIEAKAMAPDAKVAAFDPANQSEVEAYLTNLPIAKPIKTSCLSLDLNIINPKYRSLWNNLTTKVLKPILGEDIAGITPEQWNTVKATFVKFDAYMGAKKGSMVEKIDVAKLKDYLDKKDAILATVAAAITRDLNVADVVNAGKEVEKLLLMRTYLIRFLNNFVSFPELYDNSRPALFECGKLVIDGRWFNIAFPVENVAAHQALAKNSLMCILYVAVNKPDGAFNIVVPVTSGSKGNLAVGKRGVFFSLDGKEFDATVTQLVENPVCIKEALMAPFHKMWSMVEGKIEAWSGNAEKSMTSNFDKALESTKELAAEKPQPKASTPADKQGMLLGASVAVAALGSAFAFISSTLSKMSGTAIWITIVCALVALLAPISIMAIIKLSKQDLSALLEGCGWAVNLHMKLTTKLRGQFTNFGKYPAGAKGTPRSTFIPKLIIALIILGAVYYGVQKAIKGISKMQEQIIEAQFKEQKAIAESLRKDALQKSAAATEAAKKLKEAEDAKSPEAAQLKAKSELAAKDAADAEKLAADAEKACLEKQKEYNELKALNDKREEDEKKAEEAKAEEKKKAEEAKAAEEKKAAEAKAAEEKKAAEAKAAEAKAAEEKKAAEAKAAEEKKAAEAKAAEEKKATEAKPAEAAK